MLTTKKIRLSDIFLTILIYLSAAITVFLLLSMLVYVFVKGIGRVNWEFLSTVTSVLKGTVGIVGNILNTVYIIVLTLLIVTPIGVGSAIYLNEYAKPGRLVRAIEFTTETLAGIPSILFGLFGMIFFGTVCGLGFSIMTGSLTLTLVVLPLITRSTQEALRTVPDSYRNGALGIGATKWYMIRTIPLPSAMPGIITGIILAIGRMIGESAALIFTAGSAYGLPKVWQGYFTKLLDSGGTMTIQLYLSMSKGEYDVAFGIAVVLLAVVLFINFITKFLAARFDVTNQKRYKNGKH
jgi:phosphate transport system permease protein